METGKETIANRPPPMDFKAEQPKRSDTQAQKALGSWDLPHPEDQKKYILLPHKGFSAALLRFGGQTYQIPGEKKQKHNMLP